MNALYLQASRREAHDNRAAVGGTNCDRILKGIMERMRCGPLHGAIDLLHLRNTPKHEGRKIWSVFVRVSGKTRGDSTDGALVHVRAGIIIMCA